MPFLRKLSPGGPGGKGGGKGRKNKRKFSLSSAMSSAGAPVGMVTTSFMNGSVNKPATIVESEEPLTPPSPTTYVGPALSHMDFWPTCISNSYFAYEAVFDTFE